MVDFTKGPQWSHVVTLFTLNINNIKYSIDYIVVHIYMCKIILLQIENETRYSIE